jgi:alkanesulfonate monooxygenase SsuD/methylene tetrahydromethanopterin reductase-like flavin-dependent oxidoreductase (luciferase family)
VSDQQCTFGLWYDFRNPSQWHRPFSRLYREVLDQIAWAEGLGLGSAWLTEHHFVEDGYSPSPFVLAAAIGERTSAMRIGTNLIVAPLHNPVRLAEDAATVSLLTGGRFDLGLGQGYWAPEFAAFGRSVRNRPSLLEESVALIRQACPRPRSPPRRSPSAPSGSGSGSRSATLPSPGPCGSPRTTRWSTCCPGAGSTSAPAAATSRPSSAT